MEELIHHLPEILWHTLLDTLKIVPFLFLTYMLMELLEHKSGNAAERWLSRSGKVGPLVGAMLGAFPQCGFSAAASNLYTGRVISIGTLILRLIFSYNGTFAALCNDIKVRHRSTSFDDCNNCNHD